MVWTREAPNLGRETELVDLTGEARGFNNRSLLPFAHVTQARLKMGSLVQGNLLVSNFNSSANLQGTGTTIVQIAPNGTLRDIVVYSIIAGEWPTVRAHLNYQLHEKAR